MIKRSVILSINDPINTTELAMKVQSVTDGSNNIIIESVAQRVTVDVKDLKQAIEEAIEFTEKYKKDNVLANAMTSKETNEFNLEHVNYIERDIDENV
jgi:hypothetical protein